MRKRIMQIACLYKCTSPPFPMAPSFFAARPILDPIDPAAASVPVVVVVVNDIYGHIEGDV